MTTARALGHSRLRACLRVKWPLLVRPILATFAVGFAVSVAQYLPTLFAGGGRFVTVTTEAVAEAREILSAMAAAKARGEGATVYKGRLVDIASIKQAEVIVRQAELIGA